jgi:pyrophosphatase PpaX
MTGARWGYVVFDIDGTLVNSIDLIVASYQHAFRTVLGQERDVTQIKSWIGQSLYDSLQRVCPEQADALFAVYTEYNHCHTPTQIRAYPGIVALVEDLVGAGVRVGAATSKRRHPGQWALDLGGLDLVELVSAHEDVSAHKPDPAPLLLAARRLGAPPDQTVYVGDAVVDIIAAHHAGLDAIAVTWGAGVRQQLVDASPTLVCDSVEQLRAGLLPASGDFRRRGPIMYP